MRQTLIRIFLDEPWALWKSDPVLNLSGPGVAWVWLIGGLLLLGWEFLRLRKQDRGALLGTLAFFVVGLVVVSLSPYWARFLPAQQLGPQAAPVPRTSFPVFGYGFMLLIGFTSALLFARRRAQKSGLPPELMLDAGFWILVFGIAGGRLAYLLQYGRRVFVDQQGNPLGFGDALIAAVNLSQGGLVLIGGMIGGTVGFLLLCLRRRQNPLVLADVVTPSVMLGVGFGRIGCLLNGCCWGDVCTLPWAVQFPQGSMVFGSLMARGFLPPDAATTMPLHPTQLYSAANGFLLAMLLAVLFRYRRYHGEVLAWGAVLYPLTRFIIEFVRGDEMGQLGTGLTISQIYSLGIFTAGLILLITLQVRGRAVWETKPGLVKKPGF